tara:strand:+ start:130 stop:873 length:744 start_codon:yes stop_codon:yes gene_type:complete
MVDIDAVYQKVLALANKEQRGYITPQEFNLFADQAQKEIFEQYFYDINQWSRKHGNSTAHSDMITNLEEKVSLFEKYDQTATVSGASGNVSTSLITDMYRLMMVRVDYDGITGFSEAEEIQLNELTQYLSSPLGAPSKRRPVYTRYSGSTNPNALKVYPYPSSNILTDQVLLSYVKTPAKPVWGYFVVGDKALFDSGPNTTHFELHPAEEGELVYKILTYAGVTIEKPHVQKTGTSLDQNKTQQEKQ